MNLLITSAILAISLLVASALAAPKSIVVENKSNNIIFVTHLYKDFFEKKNFSQMDKYFSQDIMLYKDFDEPINYVALKKHLIEQGKICIKLSMLPFEQIFISDDQNKVFVLYTQHCTDKFNKIHNKRIMSTIKINNFQKVSKIWITTYEKKED